MRQDGPVWSPDGRDLLVFRRSSVPLHPYSGSTDETLVLELIFLALSRKFDGMPIFTRLS
jgi:hypothetical protein